MKDIQRFRGVICRKLNVLARKEMEFLPYDTIKTNSVKKHGIIVKKEGYQNDIGAILYLDEFYESYLNGEKGLESIVNELLQQMDVEVPKEMHGIVKRFGSWDQVQDIVSVKLVNTARNAALMNGNPHLNIMDLTAFFYLTIQIEGGAEAGILISDQLAELWQQDANSLFATAINNLNNTQIKIMGLANLIGEITGEECTDAEIGSFGQEMLVVTNASGRNGASLLWLSEEARRKVLKQFPNGYYIIPASIHECIVVRREIEMSPEQIKEMIMDVNATLSPEDYLSDSVYAVNENSELFWLV